MTPDPADAPARSFLFWFLFWTPAALLMFLAARVLFREQWRELKTLRFMSRALGPYFPDLDPPRITQWVTACAPHVWQGRRTRTYDSLADFATPAFVAEAAPRFAEEARAGLVFEGRLDKVLKVHPLDLRLAGPGPAPADLELRLRVELSASDAVRAPDGRLAYGKAELSQLQQFWTLRHDGRQWRLAAVVHAAGDLPALPPAPPLPPLMDWKRGSDE